MNNIPFELIRELKRLNELNSSYLDKIPYEFSNIVVGNEYAENNYTIIILLLKSVFAELYWDVEWFLNEWDPVKNNKFWLEDGTEIIINSVDDYIEYLKNNVSN
jgi:hypothetical protein